MVVHGFGSIIIILGMLLGGGEVPKDFLALVPSKTLLEEMGHKTDEDSLIQNLKNSGEQKSEFDMSKVEAGVKLIREGNYKERKEGRSILKKNLAEIGDLLEKLKLDDDPEISEYATELLVEYKKLKKDEKQKENTEGSLKILSVRALADLKSKKALNSLNPLVKSSDQSLAYEAKRAIQLIYGESLQVSKHSENLKSALKYIPQDTAILASLDLSEGTEVESLEKLFDIVVQKQPMMVQMKDQMISGAIASLPTVISNFGSARVDTIVLAMGEGAGDRDRWDVSFTFKGWYDIDRFKTFLAKNQRSRFKEWNLEVKKGEVFMIDREVALWCIDNNTMSLIISDRSREDIFQTYLNNTKGLESKAEELLSVHEKSGAKLAAIGKFSEE